MIRNPNAEYCIAVNTLISLVNNGQITITEARKTAAEVKRILSANIRYYF